MNKVHLYVADKHATLCGMWNREHGMRGNNKPHLVTCKLCKALMLQGFPKKTKPAIVHLRYSSSTTECGLDRITTNVKMVKLISEVTCKRCLIAINKLGNETHDLNEETVTYLRTARNHIKNMLHIKVPTELIKPISQMGTLVHILSYDDLIVLLEAIKYYEREVAHVSMANRVVLYNIEKAVNDRLQQDTSTYTDTADSISYSEDEVLDINSTTDGPFLLINRSNSIPTVTMRDTIQGCLDLIAKEFSGKHEQVAIELNEGKAFTIHTLARLPIKVTTQVEFKVSIKSNPCFPYTALD